MSDEPIITDSSEPLEPDEPSKPPSKRRQNRVAAMQFLYMIEMNPSNDHKASVMTFFTHQDNPREYYAFAEELVWGALEKLEDVDATIREYAKNWTFARIAKVDLAILRLAIYELQHRRDIPPIVSINEAIDLSKEFSGPDSRRFVNGILDRLKENLDRPLRSAAE